MSKVEGKDVPEGDVLLEFKDSTPGYSTAEEDGIIDLPVPYIGDDESSRKRGTRHAKKIVQKTSGLESRVSVLEEGEKIQDAELQLLKAKIVGMENVLEDTRTRLDKIVSSKCEENP